METKSGGLSAGRELIRRQAERDLELCAGAFARYGLELSAEDCRMLAEERARALAGHGRVEFGGGILPRLAEAFCDSPFLDQRNLADTLAELQDSFYEFKTEAEERFSDEELIGFLRDCFDGVCQGSLEDLRDVTWEELIRERREEGYRDGGRE